MSDEATKKSYFKVISMSFIGNALEFYDFTLYGVFAIKMGQVFFPTESEFISLIASLAAFAVAFLMRPLGALVFGSLGDKYGRRTALTISIIGIGFPTATIGLTPSFAEIGILAPIIVLLSRLIQGLCTGGEYNGAAIYCLEQIGQDRPGFFSAFLTSSCAIGAITATFLGGYFNSLDWEDAWRVPFILGFFISFLGLYLRYRIEESNEFKSKASNMPSIPLSALFKEYKISCLRTFGIGFLNGTMSYTLFGFLTIYLTRYGSLSGDINKVYLNMVSLFFFIIGNPIMGALYDKIGERRYMLFMCSFLAVAPFLAFYLLAQPSIYAVVLGQALTGLGGGVIGGVTHAIAQKLFPTLIRYRGIAFNFSLGMGLGGGVVGIAHVSLIEYGKNTLMLDYGTYTQMPSFYIAFVSIMTYLIFKLTAAFNKMPGKGKHGAE